MSGQTRPSPDNWGWQARIGMFIVASEAVPEAEWWAMCPPHVSVHAARVAARAPWARWNADRSAVTLEPDLQRAAEHFAGMRLGAVVIGHSSSSILGGAGWDAATVAAISGIVRPETQVTTNGIDGQAAMLATGVRRPFIVLPPWFNDATAEAAMAYYRGLGVAPVGPLRYDPGRGWREVPHGEMYPQGLGFEQEVEPLYAQIRAACPAEADGVFIAGTGFRCVAILDALERDLQRPVLSANQVSLWHCLRLSGVRAQVSGYGSLFGL